LKVFSATCTVKESIKRLINPRESKPCLQDLTILDAVIACPVFDSVGYTPRLSFKLQVAQNIIETHQLRAFQPILSRRDSTRPRHRVRGRVAPLMLLIMHWPDFPLGPSGLPHRITFEAANPRGPQE